LAGSEEPPQETIIASEKTEATMANARIAQRINGDGGSNP
jgi:hypothetical protein